MLKILSIFFVAYLVFRVIGFFFKILIGSSQSQSYQGRQTQYNYSKKPNEGNVNVDYVPGNKGKQKNEYKGGQYIDYEEVD